MRLINRTRSRRLSPVVYCGIAVLSMMACAVPGVAQSTDMVTPVGPTDEKAAQAPSFRILYAFKGGVDGLTPEGTLVRDAADNLYGTFTFGGDLECANGFTFGCGGVFRLDKTGQKTNLYAFDGGKADGEIPEAGLVRDSAGNLYGTTMFGGDGPCFDPLAGGCGIVFKVDKTGKETVLYAFQGGSDGGRPAGGVVRDAAGNLYGTTSGCTHPCTDTAGKVFKLNAAGHETVLHSFAGGQDGSTPQAGLIRDASGNLYGTTFYGGGKGCQGTGCGVVFRVDKNGGETVLYRFTGGADGGAPFASVIRDTAGNLYGTTYYGGDLSCNELDLPGCGVVFKLDPTGHETVLHTFTGGADGAFPVAGLIRDTAGNLYGTTSLGGNLVNCNNQGFPGCGVVLKLDTAGNETVLYSFTGGADGASPGFGSLLRDAAGNLYGTDAPGAGTGVVFEITP